MVADGSRVRPLTPYPYQTDGFFCSWHKTAVRGRAEHVRHCPVISEIDFCSSRHDLNRDIPDRAFDLGMAERARFMNAPRYSLKVKGVLRGNFVLAGGFRRFPRETCQILGPDHPKRAARKLVGLIVAAAEHTQGRQCCRRR